MTAAPAPTFKKNYPDADANPNFPRIEEEILAFWKREKLFEASVAARPAQADGKSNEFIFYDGPPFANGLPHYGHLLTGFVKDLFARYETMKGRRVERRFGWDCHGLPAEMGAEKELGISGRQDITEYGIAKFNDFCRRSVMKYTQEWEYYVTRQGRWVDFQHDYKTMDKNYMESVLWAFKQLHDKGLVYEAYRVMPYSWGAETPLSNFETRLDNAYREREDKAVTVAFELNNKPHGAPDADKYYVLAWTTTPWTLPSNLALAANEEMSYVAARVSVGEQTHCYFIAASRWADYAKSIASLSMEGVPKEAILATAHLYLRPFSKSDYTDFQQLENASEVASRMAAGVMEESVLQAEFQRFLDDQKKQGFTQWGIYERGTNRFVGRGGFDVRAFNQFDQTGKNVIELRYALRPEFWGKRYGTELCDALMEWARHNTAAEVVNAGVVLPNEASERILKKLGFAYERMVPYFGKDTIGYYAADLTAQRQAWQLPGAALLGLSYKPLFPYFAEHPHAFKILDGSDFVTDADGTGIVHMAPGFGEDDQRVCEANGITIVCPVDGAGRFTDEIFDLTKPPLSLKGLNVIAEIKGQRDDEPFKPEQVQKYGLANLRIIQWLKQTGALIKQEEIKHSYPHCWRTDTPLIYRAMPSWYVEVTKFSGRMVELNREFINWIPGHVRDGLFGKWLEGARDWSISRNRFWGTPIPVWRSKSGKLKVFGSIAELEKASGQKIKDLHRPYIDEIVIREGGEEYRRVEDVFDCWFESGSMPFAQVHYPFENPHWLEHHFPADFIVEYLAQTRGWFYTLMVLSTALFDKPPFKNCICHGVVLDDKGEKLSKRLNNYADPKWVFDTFGADALRWFMMASPVMRGNELYIDKEGKFIRDVVRLAIKPIWNAYNFFCLYANADGVRGNFAVDAADAMDRYILVKCKLAVETIRKALDEYDTPLATQAITDFFEALNNWYIRRNKERFWAEEHGFKQDAYNTLYTVLTTMCRAAAPLLPMTLEEIHKGLTGEKSVHLANFPDVKDFPDDVSDLSNMDLVRDVCTAALAIRNKVNIRVRQPLAGMTFVGNGMETLSMSPYYRKIIMDEVNVREEGISFIAEISHVASRKLQLNSAVLGKRLPEKMKQLIPASKKGEWRLLSDGRVELVGEMLQKDEFTILLEPKPEYKDRAQALSTNDALVILDTTITPELEREGIARDLVRSIQQARKDAGFNVADRIGLWLELPPAAAEAARAHQDYIAEQTLAVSVAYSAPPPATTRSEADLDGAKIIIGVQVAA